MNTDAAQEVSIACPLVDFKGVVRINNLLIFRHFLTNVKLLSKNLMMQIKKY